MDRKRWLAIVAAPAVLVVMYPTFWLCGEVFGDRVDGRLGWAVGLAIYWLLFGTLCSGWLIGWRAIVDLVRPRKPEVLTLSLATVPAVVATIGRFFLSDVSYRPANALVLVLLFVTALGNGFFEEVFWRGVYLRLFRGRWLIQIVWPSIWFGLWHLAPGSLSVDGGPTRLVIGAVFLGLYLAFVVRKTDTVWWTIVAHTLAGLVVIW